MGRLFQPLLFFLACCTEDELGTQFEFLKAENQMLRTRVPKQRIFLSKKERERLLGVGKGIGPGVRHLTVVVHPRTYQRWVSEKNGGKILKQEGLTPGPRRGPGTWSEFLKMHAETLWQTDFFSNCVWVPKEVRQCFVLAFLHVTTRRVFVSPASIQSDERRSSLDCARSARAGC